MKVQKQPQKPQVSSMFFRSSEGSSTGMAYLTFPFAQTPGSKSCEPVASDRVLTLRQCRCSDAFGHLSRTPGPTAPSIGPTIFTTSRYYSPGFLSLNVVILHPRPRYARETQLRGWLRSVVEKQLGFWRVLRVLQGWCRGRAG